MIRTTTSYLLLQFQVGVENSKVELLHKGVHIQLDFVLEKLVFQCFFARVGARAFKALFVVLQVRKEGRSNKLFRNLIYFREIKIIFQEDI